MARDEFGVGRIASPGRDIDDVQAAVDGSSHRGKLRDDEGGRMRCRGEDKVPGRGAFGRWEAWETELDVLQTLSINGVKIAATP